MKREAVRLSASPGIKLCVFCGALNHAANDSCSNCSWSGEFDYNPDHVNEVLGYVDREIELFNTHQVIGPTNWCAKLWSRVRVLVNSTMFHR